MVDRSRPVPSGPVWAAISKLLLVDRRLVGVNGLDDRLIDVDVDGIVAEIDETGYHDRTDVAATDDREIHLL